MAHLIDWWCILYALISVVLSCYANESLNEISRVLIIPLLSIMIGMTIAWTGVTFSIAMSNELLKLFKDKAVDLVDYLYMFQAVLLVLVTTIALWSLASILNHSFLPSFFSKNEIVFLCRFVLFFLLCMSVRECWGVVVGTYLLIISHINVKDIDSKAEKNQDSWKL